MGVGMVLATANPDQRIKSSQNNLSLGCIGEITDGQGEPSFHGRINGFSGTQDQFGLKYCR